MTAALAVEAAGRQGKYWEMHDALFENQASWGEQQRPDPALFEKYAQQIDRYAERFRSDVKDKSVRDRVERDIASGKALGNTGTPSFFLNGEKLENPGSYGGAPEEGGESSGTAAFRPGASSSTQAR